jgi:hypothetical protein
MALQKLKIQGFKNAGCSASAGGPLSLQVNPESYQRSYKRAESSAKMERLLSGSIAEAVIVEPPPEELSLDFYLDATGIIPGCTDVAATISSLKKMALEYNGTIHMTNFLKITWGNLLLKCQMIELNITYELFKSDGTPIRAKLSAKFREHMDPATKQKTQNKSSPDLTHVRTIRPGDSIPMLCEDIYGSPIYYLEVAKANNLANFRTLKAGQKIIFPPLDK